MTINKNESTNFCSKVIGNGQCGAALAKAYLKEFKNTAIDGMATNLARDNLERLFDQDSVIYLGVGGTGNDPEIGETKARRKISVVKQFLFEPYKTDSGELRPPRISDDDDKIIIFTSGGGGSGNGITRVITELLIEQGKEILVVISTPRRSEGVKMKINSLDLVNWFIKNCLKKDSVKGVNVALADNQMLSERLGLVGKTAAFEPINDAIIEPFKTLHSFTWKRSYDFISGNNANIDISDVKRVLFDKSGGFVDFRTFQIKDYSKPVVETESKYFGSFDINTASNYLLALELPKKGDKRVLNDIAEKCLRQVLRMTKTPNHYVSYFYSNRFEFPVGHLVVSGLRKSKAIEKLINGVKKDIDKLNRKQEAEFEELDINDLKI